MLPGMEEFPARYIRDDRVRVTSETTAYVRIMDEPNDLFERVWDVVARIPYGRVTTYGHIAGYLGVRSAARTVGWALNAAAGSGLPCHRVVNRFGALTGKRHFEGPRVMEERLRSEGVSFDEEGCVVLENHLWDPAERV